MLFSFLVDDLVAATVGMATNDEPITRLDLIELATERLEHDDALERRATLEREQWEAKIRAVREASNAGEIIPVRVVEMTPT